MLGLPAPYRTPGQYCLTVSEYLGHLLNTLRRTIYKTDAGHQQVVDPGYRPGT